jgi:signal transduction histidine kinase
MPRRIPLFLFRSVRGRLILMVAALVIPIVVLAGTMTYQAYRNQRAAIANTLISTTRAVSGVVDAKLDECASMLRALATSDALRRGDFAAIDAHARSALPDDSRWFVLLTPDGQQRVNTRVPRGTPLPKAEVEPDLAGALMRGETYVSSFRVSRATGEPVLHVSRGYLQDGALKYILSISLPPSTLARVLRLDRYAPGKVVTVVDRTGTIIARNRNAGKFVGHSATPDIVRATTSEIEGIADSVTLEKIPVVTAFSRAQCGWSTAIGAPKAELYTSARRLLVLGIAGSTLLIIVAVLMAAWIARALVRSTDALLAEAAALGRGEMPVVGSSGLVESDFVSQAMRGTAATLLRRTRTLELLNRINAGLVAERNLERIIQGVTDAGRELTGGQFGAFYYRVFSVEGAAEVLCTTSGTPRDPFAALTAEDSEQAFERAFARQSAIRVADVTAEPRIFGSGHPPGVPPPLVVRSYLAVAIKEGGGAVVGAMYFGHADPGVFTQEAEDVASGLAAEATIALDNAKLYDALARELEAKSAAERELRNAQQRLSHHAQELERRVEERTASLREAVTQMEEFSYTVSHDLRAPLRAMHAFAEALLEDYAPHLDETARDYITRIQRASRRMDQLTTDLLSYSRIIRGDVQLQPTDVDPVVHTIIEHYSELQPPSADVSVQTPLLRVMAHEPSLAQSLSNLLTNAAKFVQPGTRPKITVRTEPRGRRVRIWIEDQGIGIAPEHQDRLFRIFERAPHAQSFEGTGVGLAIVRKAVEKMGGTCGVESDGRNGSRFWLELSAA